MDQSEVVQAAEDQASRRTVLKIAGLFGSAFVPVGTASAVSNKNLTSIEKLKGKIAQEKIQTAWESNTIRSILEYLKNHRQLSADITDAVAYRVVSKNAEYFVVSFFPTYPNQGQRALTNNIAVIVQDGNILGHLSIVSEYFREKPGRVYVQVAREGKIKEHELTLLSQKNELAVPGSQSENLASAGQQMAEKFQTLEYKPGLASLALLCSQNTSTSVGTIAGISSMAAYSIRTPGDEIRL